VSAWSAERAEEHLLGLELFGMKFGLERMRRLLTVLDSPQRAFRAVHVVGTNGKSSTARFTAAILEAHGLRTGTYLSPHLTTYAERIMIGSDDLPADAFGAAVQRAAAAAEKVDRGLEEGDRVTQFELLTAAALAAFAREGVDVAVVEAGLGGRHDATAVVEAPVVVLTNVGLEHTRWLGPTVQHIAREKLAVVGPHATLVHGDLPPGIELPDAKIVRPGNFPTDLPGFQATNAALARAAAAQITEIDDAVARRAVEQTSVPGRYQRIAEDPVTIVDGAHNPSGMAALREALGDQKVTAVVSILDDKDAGAMLRELLPVAEAAVFTASTNPRALSPATLASLWEQLGGGVGGSSIIEPDPRRAVERARALGRPVVATGSIYLVADLLSAPGARRASAL
jgi:dihydrofolate synthase/folylpolyglutamate synthase